MSTSQKPPKNDQPDVRARVDHLMRLAQFMHNKGAVTLEHFYLKNLLGTSEKNICAMESSVKNAFCKKCLLLFDSSDLQVYNEGALPHRRKTCPECGQLKKAFLQPKPKYPKLENKRKLQKRLLREERKKQAKLKKVEKKPKVPPHKESEDAGKEIKNEPQSEEKQTK